jgi:2-methylcitrate dehydratase
MTLLESVVDYVTGFDLRELPPEVLRHARRQLLDTLGCAVYGYGGDASRAARAAVAAMEAAGRATVIGDCATTLPMLACLANGVAIRMTEYNDTFVGAQGPLHPSEVIPVALAVGEQVGATGADILEAIVLGYELNARWANSLTLIEHGFHHTSAGIFVVPAVAGRLLRLDREQLANAIAISCSYGLTTDAMHRGGLSMMRNLAYPLTANTGILAALLAQQGYTGPVDALDGEAGLIAQTGNDAAALRAAFEDRSHLIGRVIIKEFVCSTISQSAVSAALRISREQGLRPGDIESVRIRTFHRAWEVGGEPARRFPENKESADHSMYYVVAVGLIDGEVGPGQFRPDRIAAPDVRELIPRISIEWDRGLDGLWPYKVPSIVEITSRDGRTHSLRLDSPPGHPDNPMSDEALRSKFHGLVAGVMDPAQEQAIVDAVAALDTMPDASGLMRLLCFGKEGSGPGGRV